MTPLTREIPAGEALIPALDALCAQGGTTTGRLQLSGALAHVDLLPTPDATPIALPGPLYLVHATAVVDAGPLALHAVVSWSDRGQPRIAGGLVADAVSAGVQVVLETWDQPRAADPARADEADPHIDLSPELRALEPRNCSNVQSCGGALVQTV